MACGCGCGAPSSASCGTPPFLRPVPGVAPPTFPELRSSTSIPLDVCGTLGRDLISVADDLRDLYTDFGLRPYVVNLIKTRWSGGRRGVGVEIMDGNPVAILPTPLVTDLSSLAEINTPIGADEFGEILLQEVSGAYTEDFLRGNDQEGRPVQADQQFYYEIEFPQCDNRYGERRRFTIKGAPMYFADRFQWQVRLERQRVGRSRSGDLR